MEATKFGDQEKKEKKTAKYFQWTSDHDVILCQEVLQSEPFYLKPRSQERGKVWEQISSKLNSTAHAPKFRVTARAVRDRYSLLLNKEAQKLREEETASGIEVEQTELDVLLEELLEREKDGKNRIEAQDVDKKNKAEYEKQTAEEIRKQAMETMSSTLKRKNDDSSEEQEGDTKKKVRRSTNEAIGYLQDKSVKDHELKKEELELKRKEMENTAERQAQALQQQQDMMKVMMTQLQQQQQQQQNLQTMILSQQQQQNQILMALIQNKKE